MTLPFSENILRARYQDLQQWSFGFRLSISHMLCTVVLKGYCIVLSSALFLRHHICSNQFFLAHPELFRDTSPVAYGEICIVTDTDETLLKAGDTAMVNGVTVNIHGVCQGWNCRKNLFKMEDQYRGDRALCLPIDINQEYAR